tara:strand:- start:9307 stop:9534 length:228 start_codon:yes stop_codon:yes gene_type:complete
MNINLSLCAATLYFIFVFLMNKYSTSYKQTPRQMLIYTAVVLLSVIGTEYSMKLGGFIGSSVGIPTAAFTKTPEF